MLWVDQICINQSDMNERSFQVGLMDQIYSNALRVFIYLGESNLYVSEGLHFLGHYFRAELQSIAAREHDGQARDCHSHRPDVAAIITHLIGEDASAEERNEMMNKVVRGLYGILDRPYFSRRWILQEVAMAREVTVLLGDIALNGDLVPIWYSIEVLDRCYELAETWNTIDRESYLNVFRRAKALTELWKTFKEENERKPLWDQFENCVGYNTTNNKDQVYALLSLTSDADKFPRPDYSKTTAEVYLDFCKQVVVQSQGIRVIEAASSIESPRTEEHFPSWAPWLEDVSLNGLGDLRLESVGHHAAGSTDTHISISDNYLELQVQGQISDGVKEVGLKGPRAAKPVLSEAEIRTALEWLQSSLTFIRSWLQSEPSDSKSAEGLLAILLIQNGHEVDLPEEDFEDWEARNLNPMRVFPKRFLEFLDRLHTITEFDTTPTYTKKYDGHTWALQSFEQRIITTLWGRRIFVTNDHRVGITKSALEVGDKIAILAGGKMPFILRPHIHGYKLVGYAYIHHMMKGPTAGECLTGDMTTIHFS
ncbi:hypothetical protein EG329_012061 [Mollisiaceae sp. DMI_Dod_QoI]|nr:hypothetical protein EG329_012061 [Helotiales sp. DMI_Dod_QoI]